MELRPLALCLAGLLFAFPLVGCSNDGGSSSSGHTGPPGGPADGPADTHCTGKMPQPTSMSVCQMHGTADADYGDTMYGSEGDDDDCKYHVTWSSDDVYQDTNLDFTVTATKLADGSVATGSESYIEAYLDDKHPAPNTDPAPTAKEGPKGTYTIGPVRFDAKGKWTVRFHFFEQCTDVSEASPHGHAAFFVEVP